MSTDAPGLASAPHERGLFCNRTLNLRSIRAVGYDMDYTLVQYFMDPWERRAYEHLRTRLAERGFAASDLTFDPSLVIRGLVIDVERGNLCKANRFGYIKAASHGTRRLGFDELRSTYARTIVDLAEPRWVFLNTLFSLSEACMLAQLVDRYDEGAIEAVGKSMPRVHGYADLYDHVRSALDATHAEGQLKLEIAERPERFIELDPEAALAIRDQRAAGKKVLLVTNSEWTFTQAMMSFTFDRYLDKGTSWRDLFDLVVVAADKPGFFSGRAPFYEVVSDDGLLRPVVGKPRLGQVLHGGNASVVEELLGASGDEILYVGDHIYGDVHASKSVLRWRTALVVRELEEEIAAMNKEAEVYAELPRCMLDKERLEAELCHLRLEQARRKAGYGPVSAREDAEISRSMTAVRARIAEIDEHVAPLARRASTVGNPHWGPIMWAGNDKSHLARQVERSADVYTSRVSNFALATPFVYLRSPRGTMPHDAAPAPEPGGMPALRTGQLTP